jgi:hypothetical protein
MSELNGKVWIVETVARTCASENLDQIGLGPPLRGSNRGADSGSFRDPKDDQ